MKRVGRKLKSKYLGGFDFKTMSEGHEFETFTEDDMSDDIRVFDGPESRHFYAVFDDREKALIKPGCYESSLSQYGELILSPSKINLDRSFGGVELQNEIEAKCNIFFEKESVYKKLGIKPRRGFLLWGPAGTGKTFVVNRTLSKLLNRGDTIVLKFDTTIRISALAKLLSNLEPTSEVKKVCLILEDIGGGEADPEAAQAFSDTSLLSFLDGNSYHLELPLVIFATTNYPQNMLANLIDRPGRFDDVIEVLPPSIQVKTEFMESLLDRPLTPEEKVRLTKKHSMAHVKEAVVRHLVFDEDVAASLIKLSEHSEKVENKFNKDDRMGF